MANGWTGEGAEDLAKFAREVEDGKRHRVGNSSWVSNIIEIWRSDAGVTS